MVLVACPENVVTPKFASAEQQLRGRVPLPSQVRCFSQIHSKRGFGLTASSGLKINNVLEGKQVLEKKNKTKKNQKGLPEMEKCWVTK